MANTRLRRCIHDIGAWGSSTPSMARAGRGTVLERYLKFVAKTPWNRVRLNFGRGTNAARYSRPTSRLKSRAPTGRTSGSPRTPRG
jgi:hypothetical protein